MPNYSDVAVQAAHILGNGQPISAREAWNNAVVKVFPDSPSMQAKGCPRTIFLTLCASGAIMNLPAIGIVGDSKNATHARHSLSLLARHPEYVTLPTGQLWKLVTDGSGKSYNQQMHVILGLAHAGLLRLDKRPA